MKLKSSSTVNKNLSVPLPESVLLSDLIYSRQTFMDCPIGTKALIFSSCALVSSIFHTVFAYLISTGYWFHIDVITFHPIANIGKKCIIRAPGVIIVSTRIALLALPIMIVVFTVLSSTLIILAKKREYGGGLVAISFAFIVSALIVFDLSIPLDIWELLNN